MLDTLTLWFYKVDIQDFKFALAQVFQWYQSIDKRIQELLAKEQTVNLFDDSGAPSSTDVNSKHSRVGRGKRFSNNGFTIGSTGTQDNVFSLQN